MPLVKIRRDPNLVTDSKVLEIRDVLHTAVRIALKIDDPDKVELRVEDIGLLDLNCPPVAVEIDTGTGDKLWRVDNRIELARQIAAYVEGTGVIPSEWLGSDKSYVWLKICYSAFIPIGCPENAR